jgi:dTDP-4-dehydrorhamnose reductase
MMILIVGAGGRVGGALERALQESFPDRVIAASREELDITDPGRLAMELERFDPSPTVAINCAALTDAPNAESDPGAHQEVNRMGVGNLARACRELGCRLIHLSTVDVFSGSLTAPYREEDAPDAKTQYGVIRHLGELAAAEGCADHLILRMSLFCGDGHASDPLVALETAATGGGTLPWHDRLVTPIWMEDFVSLLPAILRSDWKGVLHLGNTGACLLSELSAEVARLTGVARPPELVGGKGPASFWDGSGPNGALNTSRFARLSGRRLREWRQALAATLGRES